MAANPEPPPSFEQCLAELEAVVKELEGGELPLERALALFERGAALSDTCRRQLQEAETRVEMVVRRGNRTEYEPFQPEKP